LVTPIGDLTSPASFRVRSRGIEAGAVMSLVVDAGGTLTVGGGSDARGEGKAEVPVEVIPHATNPMAGIVRITAPLIDMAMVSPSPSGLTKPLDARS